MKARSISGASTEQINIALKKSMEDGFRPTVAIVFISVKQDREAVAALLHQQGIDIAGATSSGEFVNGHQSEGETAILLLDIKKEHYRIFFRSVGDQDLADVAASLAKDALKEFEKPGFILCSTLLTADGRIMDGETLIRNMESVLGSSASIYGGMAGDDISFTGTYVFTHDQSTDYGMIAFVVDEKKIALHGMAVSGWKPMGISRTATKTEGNLIYTIDNQPALEMYLRFLGMDASSADDQVSFFDSVGVHYPFQVERENRAPMMCNPIGYDKEKKALLCEASVPEGSTFRFSTPPDFDIIETVIEKAKHLKEKLATDAEALLIFSCASRLSALGPMANQENEGLQEVWNAPMAGFYTYGEIGAGENGNHEVHSTTCCWVALKEIN